MFRQYYKCEQIIICRQLFAGHMVGCWPMEGKKKLHQMIISIIAPVQGRCAGGRDILNFLNFIPLTWTTIHSQQHQDQVMYTHHMNEYFVLFWNLKRKDKQVKLFIKLMYMYSITLLQVALLLEINLMKLLTETLDKMKRIYVPCPIT